MTIHRPDVEQEHSRDINDINALLKRTADEVNESLGGEYLDDDGRITDVGFGTDEGGSISMDVIKRNRETVLANEASWAGVYDDDQRNFLAIQYGVKTEGRTRDEVIADLLPHVPEMIEARKMSDGSVAETVAFVTVQRALGHAFTAALTNRYDDEGGVDLAVRDNETGDVFGVIDIVTDRSKGQRAAGKGDKVLQKNRKGGARIQYGLGGTGSRPERVALEGVPTFAFTIPQEQLNEYLFILTHTDEVPAELMEQGIASMEEQAKEFLQNPEIRGRVKTNIVRFLQVTIPHMRQVYSQRLQQAA